ncbi:MAG TPA: glycosyltransferase, partial [candidate division Zixibacteria bacterium]|nr:glycosyltransferase [candidate division Zixibacteria bacterium]
MPRDAAKVSVLHLRASNFYGGPERQLHCHARAARDSVFEVIVASYAESGRSPDLLARVAADRLPTHLVGVAGAYDRRALGLIRRVLRDRDIAILCTHDYRSTVLGCLAVRFTPVRWIAFSRGRTRETLRIRLYNELERLCLRFADRVVAVSEGEKASLRRRLVPDRRIAVVHNAIDTAAFAAVTPVDLKSRFGFPAHSLVAVAAGRFSPEK